MRPRKLSDQQAAEVVDAYRRGESVKDICARLDLKPRTVYVQLQIAGATRKPKSKDAA